MSKKPLLAFTRPWSWAKMESDVFDLVHVPMGDTLRTGQKHVPDEMGTCATKEDAEHAVEVFKKRKPDYFLSWTHYGKFDEKLLARLRAAAPRCVFVHGNGNQVMLMPYNVCNFIHRFHKFYDVVLTNTRDKARMALSREWVKRVATLYTYGFDPEVFTAPKTTPEFDCFFGGGDSVSSERPRGRFPPFSRMRRDLICGVHEKHSLLLRGGGTWPPNLGCKNGMRGIKYFRQIQRARIVLGTYHDDLYRRYTKRTIYGLASGRMVIMRYVPGMEKDFENHKHLVWFKKVPEGLELVAHYLKHHDEREKIARAGRKLAVEKHDWAARLRDLEVLYKAGRLG